MAIRYFNIKIKPDVGGSAIKINTENPLNKTIEDISSNYYFNKIRETEKYSHFKLFEGHNIILRDSSKKMEPNPEIFERVSDKSLARICVDDLGNVRLYKNKKKLLIKEISKSKAYNIKGDAMRWKMMQSWV